MKKFQVPFYVVENGICRDMLANVSADTEYQAILIVRGTYAVYNSVIDVRVDCDNIREVIDILQ